MKRRWMMTACAMWLVSVSLCGAAAEDTRVLEAVKRGDKAAVGALVKQRADVKAGDAIGMTPLHWAVQGHDVELATLLIRAGASTTASTRYGATPLYLAAVVGNAPMIELLLKSGADSNQTLAMGETILMVAARSGVVDAVKVVLASGANVNARTQSGQTALMWAVDEQVPVIRLLVEAGADVGARTDLGFTALLFAVRDGRLDAVRALVQAGADVNDQIRPSRVPTTDRQAQAVTAARGIPGSDIPENVADLARFIIKHSYTAPDGDSVLGVAIVNAQFDVAQFLVEHGANPNAPDPRGSFLHAIAYIRRPGDHSAGVGGDRPPLPTGDSLTLAKTLLERGADPNVRINWEEWPFDIDASMTRLPANIHVGRPPCSNVGATPYYLAAKHGDVALMRVLAAHGANPTIATIQNVTPLMAAAGLGYWEGESPGPEWGTSESEAFEAVKLAWELDPNVNAVTNFGEIPPFKKSAENALFSAETNLENHGQAVGDLRWAGSTALHGAALRGQIDIVQFLIDKGAKLDARNTLGWTPLTVAGGLFVGGTAKPPRPQVQDLLMKLMRERGLDVPAVRGRNTLTIREKNPGRGGAQSGGSNK